MSRRLMVNLLQGAVLSEGYVFLRMTQVKSRAEGGRSCHPSELAGGAVLSMRPASGRFASPGRGDTPPGSGAFVTRTRTDPHQPAYHGVVVVGIDEAESEDAKIEKNQKALRDSIEQTKRLSAEADKLVQQNRQALENGDADEAR
jgi:hypothetical protein